MNNSKDNLDIVFLGLAQNCEKYLDNFFDLINKIKTKINLKVIIGENGSNDFTFDKIQQNIKHNKDILFVDTTFIEDYENRIKRLALARQKLKEVLVENNFKPKFICVVDLDDVISQNFDEVLINTLMNILNKNSDNYFAASLSSTPYYYDILNFESDEFPNLSIKKLQNNKSINSYKDRKKYIYDVQKKLTIDGNLECISGFNGMCIYLFSDFVRSNYIKNKSVEDPDPEHLFFNRFIHKTTGKKILITNNYLKMPDEHRPLSNFTFFIIQKLFKYISIYIRKKY
tara:strand:+ start:6222 stop:7079 length:858 start_codon:yes stop_codon:yes gene_type:complete